MLDYLEYVLIAILCLIVIYIVLRAIARKYKTNPFRYPYLYTFIDITGTRNPNIYDLIDQYLIDNGISRFIDYPKYVEIWKKENLQKANKAFFSKQRLEQYYSVIDDNRMFIFSLTKKTTKYTQKNYVRTSYKEDVIQGEYGFNLATIKQRYDELKKIDFVCTISEYNSNYQRKLMTKELRQAIAERDNYTCQICGKYMPDGVGLHIDHIIPINKGGKSIPSNLQVLCSKCNGSKSNKI